MLVDDPFEGTVAMADVRGEVALLFEVDPEDRFAIGFGSWIIRLELAFLRVSPVLFRVSTSNLNN
ncbi:hypothetical protein AXFE_00290 [Acidithrix ferrooxidans]|uniref:Uncharacterized protein n=2 Tax=Acidithrix ferrooxidans TaxID=1280514 RepID=A0A0D8HML5_9ACTN|nr:hypothetical protein AXFE_00290 [Acidithrix ferrooxidans]